MKYKVIKIWHIDDAKDHDDATKKSKSLKHVSVQTIRVDTFDEEL